jgi:hypothetical protein
MLTVFLVWSARPSAASAEIKLEADRVSDTNSLDLAPPDSSSEKIYFNRIDCLDNIKFTFEVTESESEIDGDLYLAAGSGCDDEDKDDDDCFFEKVSSGKEITVTLRELLAKEGISDSEDCSGSGSIGVWGAKLSSLNGRDTDAEDWSDSVTISWDMDPPNAPDGIFATPGNQKILVKWAADDAENDAGAEVSGLDNDVEKIIVLYTSESSSTGTDSDDTETGGTDGTSDGGTSDGGVSDGGVSGTGGPSPRRYNIVQKSSAATACDSFGFQKGDNYIPDRYKEKSTSNPSNGELSISGLKNGNIYKFALAALDDYNNPSTLSETLCSSPGETVDFLDEYTAAGGKTGEFCFIATAAFGSYDHPVVKILRRFRDNFLALLPGGRVIIDTYYRIGPSLAKVVSAHPALKSLSQGALFVFALTTVPLSLLGPLYTLLLCAAIAGAVLFRRKRTHR